MGRVALPTSPLLPFALGVLMAILFAFVALAIARAMRRARLRARWSRALEGERKAAGLLEREGYTVLGSQVSAQYTLSVDDRTTEVRLRADYVVEKGGRSYVAEVKTGVLAPQIQTAATRRQLLEYRMAFAISGVLLVDVEAGQIHSVVFDSFEAGAEPTSGQPIVWTAILAACLAAAAAWLLYAG